MKNYKLLNLIKSFSYSFLNSFINLFLNLLFYCFFNFLIFSISFLDNLISSYNFKCASNSSLVSKFNTLQKDINLVNLSLMEIEAFSWKKFINRLIS